MPTVRRVAFLFGAVLLVHCGRARFDADCTLDERGSGRCDVTNSGSAAGNHCFRVRVSNKRNLHPPVATDLFCSGQMAPKATKRVAFVVPGFREVCRDDANASADAGTPSSSQACDFAVVDDLPPRPHAP